MQPSTSFPFNWLIPFLSRCRIPPSGHVRGRDHRPQWAKEALSRLICTPVPRATRRSQLHKACGSMVVMPKRRMKLAVLPWNTLLNEQNRSETTIARSLVLPPLNLRLLYPSSPLRRTFPRERYRYLSNVYHLPNHFGTAISSNYIDILLHLHCTDHTNSHMCFRCLFPTSNRSTFAFAVMVLP
jgi:hypothetical protein